MDLDVGCKLNSRNVSVEKIKNWPFGGSSRKNGTYRQNINDFIISMFYNTVVNLLLVAQSPGENNS